MISVLLSRYLDLQLFLHAITPRLGLGGKGAAVSMGQKVSMSPPQSIFMDLFPGEYISVHPELCRVSLPPAVTVAAACIALPSPCLVGCSKA